MNTELGESPHGTSYGEHCRTLELFKDILERENGVCLALFFLHDCQADLKLLADIALEQYKQFCKGN